MTEAPSGTGNEDICKSNIGAAMALRAACIRINKTDNTHTHQHSRRIYGRIQVNNKMLEWYGNIACRLEVYIAARHCETCQSCTRAPRHCIGA